MADRTTHGSTSLFEDEPDDMDEILEDIDVDEETTTDDDGEGGDDGGDCDATYDDDDDLVGGGGHTDWKPRSDAPPVIASGLPRDEALRQFDERMKDMYKPDAKKGEATTFLWKHDPVSGERRPRPANWLVAGVVGIIAVAGSFKAVQGDDTEKAQAAQTSAAASAKNTSDKAAVAAGSRLHQNTRYSAAGLEAVEDTPEPDVVVPPIPPPELVQEEEAPAAAPPPRPRPTAPDTWRTSLGMTIPDVDDGPEPSDDSSLGVSLPEGTEIPVTLTGRISAPNVGLDPELNRVKGVVDEAFVLDGVEVFPKGTLFLGRVEKTNDKKVHIRWHRVVFPDETTANIRAIALDADLSAGLIADKVDKHRSRNLAGRIARGVVDTAANVATGGRGVGAVGGGAAGGAADQAREEANDLRVATRTLRVDRGRKIFVQFTADAEF